MSEAERMAELMQHDVAEIGVAGGIGVQPIKPPEGMCCVTASTVLPRMPRLGPRPGA